MAETYCGKSCIDCDKKEELSCPGCKLGPGKYHSGDCDIAKCCRENGHMSCATCAHSRNYCAKYNTRGGAADFRLEKIRREERKKKIAAERATVLGKSLWIIFWLCIVKNVLGIFSTELLGGVIPMMAVVANIGTIALNIAVAISFMGLQSQDSGYRTAGICYLVAAVMDLAMTVLGGAIQEGLISILISVPALLAGLIGHYKFYITTTAMLEEVDDELSEKWSKLWKWYLITFIVTLASLLVLFIIPLLGVLLVLVGAVGTIIVGIMELLYLYRTARAFQGFTHILQLTD